MSTRVILRGQAMWASRDYRPALDRTPRRRDGSVIDDERVLPDSPDSPFRAGVPYYDADDVIEYRAVRAQALDPRSGWRTADFWLDRWSTEWKTLRALVERGWLDAAIEEGTATKRFRCRDESRVLESLKPAKETPRDHRRGLRRNDRQR